MVSNEFPLVSKVTNIDDEKFLLKYAILSNIRNIAGLDLRDRTQKKLSVGFWSGQSSLKSNEEV